MPGQPQVSRLAKDIATLVFTDSDDPLRGMTYLTSEMNDGSLGVCYGVWITQKHLLTAAHCVFSNLDHPDKILIYRFATSHSRLWSTGSKVQIMDQGNCPKDKRYKDSEVCPSADLAIIEADTPNRHAKILPISKKQVLTANASDSVIPFTSVYQGKDHDPETLIFRALRPKSAQSDGTAYLKLDRQWSDGIGPGSSGTPIFGIDTSTGEVTIAGVVTSGEKHFFDDVSVYAMDLGSDKSRAFISSIVDAPVAKGH